ncbi:PREDICTED: uncharacterized protein LOC106121390 [Papilio xuthus]|uniref:Oxidative stress-responsive serine-rich protein 1 n=1 Tax=Papilio xuthus TaxID=66420 RepID=A0AAJ7ED31_PAPXU|nr:PREDICTED: uncharacterized protein LOC106121390 [Papilio xuthus]
MAGEEVSLRLEMGRLEIEPIKPNKQIQDENPFTHISLQKKWPATKSCVQSYKCACTPHKKNSTATISKKRNNKILREPVLKLTKHFEKNELRNPELLNHCKLTVHKLNTVNVSLKALVDNCNQLSLCSDNNVKTEPYDKAKWWKNDVSSDKASKETSPELSQAGTCSQQALNPPCDVTIDELASYFETLVHIPKKMSSMAEMMYI